MITINVDLSNVPPKKLAALTANVNQRLASGINKATDRLNNQIKLELSKGGGQSRKGKNLSKHLRVQSGDLRSSWVARPATTVGGIVEGHVSTSTKYAAIHEYGGTIVFHPRTFLRGGRRNVSVKLIGKSGKKLKKRQVITRDFGALSQGRTTGWSVTIPERPYVGPALKSVKDKMINDVAGEFTAPIK